MTKKSSTHTPHTIMATTKSPSVPTVVEKHVLALTIALQPFGMVTGPIPALNVEWLHAFNEQWPTLLSSLKKSTTDPSSIWNQAWCQSHEAVPLTPSMWTKQVRDQVKKYGKRIYEDSKMWVTMTMTMSNSMVASGAADAGGPTKGALPHRVWEKFGIILPESIACLLEEIMETLGQELVSSLKGSDEDQPDVQDVFANIQRRFMEAIEQGKITEKDIKDTLTAFRNSLSGMADHAPPELRGIMKNRKKNMDQMMKKKKKPTKEEEDPATATSDEKGDDEKETEATSAAPSADVEEMMSMFTEFFQFVSDLQTRPELMQQGAHPFMKKMMKKAVKMMNKKGSQNKPKLTSKERLQRLLNEQAK